MRNTLLSATALFAGLLLGVQSPNAKPITTWDQTVQQWVTYDTQNPAFYSGGSSISPIPREVIDYRGPFGPNTIVVNTAERRLYYVIGQGKAIRYGVGVGRQGFQWAGINRISQKAEWPTWTPPPQMRRRVPNLPASMPGGVNNPLGARALYIGATLFRIHGSNEPWTIGQAVSSGCIRMTNEDVTDLYDKVAVGTKVVVIQ